jgi:DNA replication protein DnaC
MNALKNSSQITQLESIELAQCSEHGPYEARVRILTIADDQVSFPSKCPKCQAERSVRDEARRIEAYRFERARVVSALRNASGVPERFRDANIAGFEATTDSQVRVVSIVARYVETFEPKSGMGLLLLGGCGSGKTLLACATVNALVEQGYSALYMRTSVAVDSVKATYAKTSTVTKSEAIARLVTPDLLVLDEVGMQLGTDHEALLLFEILNGRYEGRRSTVLISNLNAAEIDRSLGERLNDRLHETCAFLAFDWPSYRRRRAA